MTAEEEEEVAGVFCYFAESEEEAGKIAEAIGAEIIAFEHGIAEVLADEASLSEAGPETEIYTEYIYTTYDTLDGSYIGPEQWYAEAVGLKDAWQYARGENVLVAVIDSGIDVTHGELKGAIADAVSVIPDEAYETYVGSLKFDASCKGPQDNLGHGTHVSGIIAAADDNYGCVGIAPKSGILSIKALEKSGSRAKGLTSWVVAGIRMAIERDADVINLSLGGSVNIDPMIQRAVDEAVSSGITVVSAAGNISGTPMVYYPAACEGVIGVSALKEGAGGLEFDGSYSNYGALVDISAPGTDIYSTEPGGYGYRKGTSAAAPVVSGTAALLLSIKNDMPPDEIAGFLYDTACDLGEEGRDDYYGNGSVDIAAAVKACSEKYTEEKDPVAPPESGDGAGSDDVPESGDGAGSDDTPESSDGAGSDDTPESSDGAGSDDTPESGDGAGSDDVPESGGVPEDGKDSGESGSDGNGDQPPENGSEGLSIPAMIPETEEDVMYAMDKGTDPPETVSGNMAETEIDSTLYEKDIAVTGQNTQPDAEMAEEDQETRRRKPWIVVVMITAGLILCLLKWRNNAMEKRRKKGKGEGDVKDF